MRYASLAVVATALIAVVPTTGNAGGNVEYTLSNGDKTDDITKVQEYAKFTARDPKQIPREARALHDQGRRYGSEGKLDLAVASFRKASEMAPDWAYPIYDTAYTLLLQGKQDEALALYRRVDGLEPRGFFTTKTAIWSLQREIAGQLPRGTYNYYLTFEDIRDIGERGARARQLWDKLPGFAPAFKEYAISIRDQGEKLKLIEQGLSMDADAETRGVLLLNKAGALDAMGRSGEAVKLLQTLRDDDNQTVWTRTAATELLKVVGVKKN